MRERARLIRIGHDREITRETDSQFLFQYQRAVLLALKDSGVLTQTQCRCGEERLKAQLRRNAGQRSSADSAEWGEEG